MASRATVALLRDVLPDLPLATISTRRDEMPLIAGCRTRTFFTRFIARFQPRHLQRLLALLPYATQHSRLRLSPCLQVFIVACHRRR